MIDIKEKIIESATKCFIQYGFNKTTLEDIGKSVGLKKNSLYHYFKNKEDLFKVVISKELDKISSQYYKKVHEANGIKNKIITYFDQKIKLCNNKNILTAILSEIMNVNHPLYKTIYTFLYQKEIDFICSLLNTAFKEKEIIKCDFKRFAESLSYIFGLFKQQQMSCSIINKDKNIYKMSDKHIFFIIETMLKGIEAN